MALPAVILDYLFSTSPSRLQVSTATAAATGRIDVSVSSGSTDKYCSQIMVAVPIGTEATDFSENTPTATVNTADWSVSSVELVTGTDLGLETDASFASFTFAAKDASVYQINYNLVFSLSATVNETVGSFAYIVRETSGTDATTLTEKQSTFDLDKVLPSFYLENLVATTTASPLAPATEFANGAAIRLAWESNGTWFQLYEKGNATPIYSGPAKTFTVASGTATDTTYFLQASMTGDPGNDGSGFEPIYLFDSVTVTITNPDLTPKTVAVSGVLRANGATSLNDTSVNGTLGVSGATSLKSTNVDGTLNVAKATTLADALTIQGVLSLAGTAGLFGNATALSISATYTATTDGIVVGTADGSNLDLNEPGNGAICATSGSTEAWATGGTRITMITGTWSSWNYFPSWSTNSFVLPVKKGDSFTLSTVSAGNAPIFSASWIPIGVGSLTTAPSESPLVRDQAMPTMEVGITEVTSPLSVEAEFHHSGRASLSNGTAKVEFGADIADLLFHNDSEPYKVLLTPTSQVGGRASGRGGLWRWLRRKLGVSDSAVALTVTVKARDHFVVEQLGGGADDIDFDWFIIARKPDGLGVTSAKELPDALPKMAVPAPPPEGSAASAEKG